jgi:hypothetical protein
MTFYQTSGNAVKSLDIDDVFGAGFAASLTGQQEVVPRVYYAVVPFMRRATRIRCNAVAGVPVTLERNGKDISARPEFASLMNNLSQLIWKTEFALCLSPYGAYWRKSTNRAGLNPTPEWLLPHSCWPYITAEAGLEYIRYIHPWGVPRAGTVDMLPLEDVVYFWYPSLDRANWPGPCPGLAALAAASALANRDLFVSNYFNRGAIKGVLLQVPTATNPEERTKLKTWWDQLFAGVKNAWRSIVISADVKPVVIGEGLKETESDKLTAQYRQDVAAAFEVPESMLLSNAANYATAREERISFYEETVFPELDLILDAINTQWLRDAYDAELVAHPEQTEAAQDAQVQQATAITELVGQPVLTVNEGRGWLGMEPMEDDEPDVAPDEAGDYQAMETEASADDIAEQAAETAHTTSGDPERITDAERVPDVARIIDTERVPDDERPAAPVKTLRHPNGQYHALPGSMGRTQERQSLLHAHATARSALRARHHDERTQARMRQIGERSNAKDARTRLKLVHQHKAELATLVGRQASERSMLRSLHTAERGRLKARHAAARTIEHASPIALNGYAHHEVYG